MTKLSGKELAQWAAKEAFLNAKLTYLRSLWAVQLNLYPDSVKVDPYTWLTADLSPSRREQMLRSISLTHDYVGFFYEVPRSLGLPAWRGFRYGLADSEYMSGFGSY